MTSGRECLGGSAWHLCPDFHVLGSLTPSAVRLIPQPRACHSCRRDGWGSYRDEVQKCTVFKVREAGKWWLPPRVPRSGFRTAHPSLPTACRGCMTSLSCV